jgi:type IV secretory pathway ATPase VirB11/archaellum biosynthesis ATPase
MFSIQKMVEGALRSHPDWLLIAESRGAEFKEVLRSVKTGHPIITTLHSDRLDHVYDRMVSMLLIEESITHLDQLFTDVKKAFPVLIQLVSVETQKGIHRQIDQVSIVVQGQRHLFNSTVTNEKILEVMNVW